MDAGFVVSAFVTLFVIIDPIGLVPIFLALTQGASARARRAIGLRACLVAAALLSAFALFGEEILAFVGITMPAFKIAGGILLFLTALDMLFERRTARREGKVTPAEDPAVFPLAMPLIAGPGAMAAMILLAGQAEGNLMRLLSVHLVMLAVVAICFVLLLLASPIERGLGRTGALVVTRLLGMLLGALSVQFVLDGLRDAGVVAGAVAG